MRYTISRSNRRFFGVSTSSVRRVPWKSARPWWHAKKSACCSLAKPRSPRIVSILCASQSAAGTPSTESTSMPGSKPARTGSFHVFLR